MIEVPKHNLVIAHFNTSKSPAMVQLVIDESRARHEGIMNTIHTIGIVGLPELTGYRIFEESGLYKVRLLGRLSNPGLVESRTILNATKTLNTDIFDELFRDLREHRLKENDQVEEGTRDKIYRGVNATPYDEETDRQVLAITFG